MTIIVPMIDQQYSEQFSQDAAAGAGKIYSQYGAIISAACQSVGLDPSILVGFMLVENTDADPTALSYNCSDARQANFQCAVGLMQLQPATAYQAIKDQSKYLNPAELAIIQKYVPQLILPGSLVAFLTASNKQAIEQALLVPEFSIWIGAILLAQLMKKSRDANGNPRLDHVIVRYNRGYGNYLKEVVLPGLSNADATTLAASLPVKETRDYLVKYLGVKGSLYQAIKS